MIYIYKFINYRKVGDINKMSDIIKELRAKIKLNENLIATQKKTYRNLEHDIYQLKQENETLHKQIKQIEMDKFDDDFAKKMIERGYVSIGKTDGKNDRKIYAECHENHLYLFKAETGIGAVIVGICPICENEINFTNYSNW